MAVRGPQRNKVPQSFPPGSLFQISLSFLSQVSSLLRYTTLHRNSILPKQKPSAPDWISRLPSPRPGVEIKIESQTEIELKLLCSSPPEQISADYLHVKGIFDLWGISWCLERRTLEDWCRRFHPVFFLLSHWRGTQYASRHSCALPLPLLGARNPQPYKSSGILSGEQGLSKGWLGRVGDGGGGEVRGAAEYKGNGRENAVSSP